MHQFTSHPGQAVDGPNMGPAPLPWDIPVNPGDKFMKKIIKLEVPHTASVKVINDSIFLQLKCSKTDACKRERRVTHAHFGYTCSIYLIYSSSLCPHCSLVTRAQVSGERDVTGVMDVDR